MESDGLITITGFYIKPLVFVSYFERFILLVCKKVDRDPFYGCVLIFLSPVMRV